MKKLDLVQKRIADFQESLDQFELDAAQKTTQQYEQLNSSLQEIEEGLGALDRQPESTAISYRLKIQEFKSALKLFKNSIKNLEPKLDVPWGQPMLIEDLYQHYIAATRFYLKDDAFNIEAEVFATSVKTARLRARQYYDGAKTHLSLAQDKNGPFIQIKRRPS